MTITNAVTHGLASDCCELGEGPHYDIGTDTAWWFDIVERKLLEHRFGEGETLTHLLPEMASVVASVDDGRQLLAAEKGLYLRDISSGDMKLLSPLEAGNSLTRSNDGRVHPSGRLWIGTMGKKAEREAGTIYWFDGTAPRVLYRNISIPNSICFSPDGRTGYFSDTALDTVWRVAVDPSNGLPAGEPEPFLSKTDLPLGGHFDGSITDADGNLWNAAWGGRSVSCFTPGGDLVRTFEVPAAQASCPAFVGKELNKMLVTTAWQGLDKTACAADPGAGFTYVIDGGFRGKAEPAFLLPEAIG